MNVFKITPKVDNLKIAIITVAGISSRFNKDVPEENKILKCIYWEDNPKNTLLYQLIDKLSSYDKIIVVGGFKFDDLAEYVSSNLPQDLKEKISLYENGHYDDLSSGYSLYLGVKEALTCGDIDEILFVEGDLDIDDESFLNVINSDKNVITFNREPIYSNKAVVVYQNENDDYKYLFNSNHGLLSLTEPFKVIFNSGQTWKFKDMGLLKIANDNFKENLIEDTNLAIIQKYFDLVDNDEIEMIELTRWVNCNTREDYKIIKDYWSE
jgi:choline kinase